MITYPVANDMTTLPPAALPPDELHLLEAGGEPLGPSHLRPRLPLPDELPVHQEHELLQQAAVIPRDAPQHVHLNVDTFD